MTTPPLLATQQQLYHRLVRIRDRLVRPVVILLATLHISPHAITALGLIASLAFIFAVRRSLPLALILLLAAVLLDALDGALARYRQTASDRGKLFDVIADAAVFTLFVIGLGMGEVLAPAVAWLLACTMLLNKIIRVVYHRRYLTTDWRFRAVAGFLPTALSFLHYLVFAWLVITGYNYLLHIAIIASILLIGDSILTFRKSMS